MGKVKHHIMPYINEKTDYAIALAMDQLTSDYTEIFFNKDFPLRTFAVSQVITDNGSELKVTFAKATQSYQIKHYHTYPNTLKRNAFYELYEHAARAVY